VLIELFFALCYGWGATSEYWLEISVFEGSWPVSAKFSRSRGRPPRTIFCTDRYRPINALNFVADSIHTKKLCSWLSSSELQSYTENGCLAFLSLPLAAYGQRTMLSEARWKAHGGLPISVNWTFFRYVLRLSPYERISIENRRFHSNRVSLAQNFR